MSPGQRAVLPTVLDIIVPVAGYYLLTALGLTDLWALTVSGVLAAAYTVAATIRRGRLDGVATLVVIEIALSIALLIVTQDPRIVLLKPSFYTAVAGLYLLWSSLTRRPLTLETARPFATKGDPALERACDRAWDRSTAFRREHRRLTAIWGVLLVAASLGRAVLVVSVDVSTGVWAGALPGIAAALLALAYTATRRDTLIGLIERHRGVAA
jgi:hypothetical protein